MNTFKNGDKVYCPMVSTEIYKLVDNDSDTYPIRLFKSHQSFTINGKFIKNYNLPHVFHATLENKKLLEKLYGVEFESQPPKTRTVTFEMPETFDPRFGEGYWYITSSSDEICDYAVNYESGVDDARINRGVWRTEKEALQVANAIFKLNKD